MDTHNSPPTALSGETFQFVPEPGSRKLIIFFTATGAAPNFFNFWRPGNELRCHRLFVNNGRNEWYQSGIPGLGVDMLETIDTIRRWADHLGATEIYTSGGSMGGHGAILYGSQLRARVLAFAPETILMLPKSRCERLMHPEAVVRFPDLTPFITQARKPIYMYVGEMDPIDVYSGRHVRDLPNITVKSLRRVTHGPASYLHNRGRLVPLLNRFIDNEPLPDMEEEGKLLWIEGFPELYYRTHCHYENREWAETIETGLQTLELFSATDYCQLMVGESYLKLKQEHLALPHLALAKSLAPMQVENNFLVAHCLRRLGYPSEAAYLHRLTLKIWPDHAKTHYCLGNCLEAGGHSQQALVSFRRAAELDPKNVSFQRRLARLEQIQA